jgi:hypothetical protein
MKWKFSETVESLDEIKCITTDLKENARVLCGSIQVLSISPKNSRLNHLSIS